MYRKFQINIKISIYFNDKINLEILSFLYIDKNKHTKFQVKINKLKNINISPSSLPSIPISLLRHSKLFPSHS